MSFEDRNVNQIIEHEVCPRACRALWCAVIEDQFRLAVAPRASDLPREIDSARRWFGSRDFFMTCALAGLDGAWVLWGVHRRFEIAGVG
jgi:hypothetical protein